MIGWENYTLTISLVSKGFPYKHQIEELFIVMYVYPTRNIFNFLRLISLFKLQRTYHDVAYLYLKAIKPQLVSQSVWNPWLRRVCKWLCSVYFSTLIITALPFFLYTAMRHSCVTDNFGVMKTGMFFLLGTICIYIYIYYLFSEYFAGYFIAINLTVTCHHMPVHVVCVYSYSNCSLVKYMDKHKVRPDSKAFLLVCTLSVIMHPLYADLEQSDA